MTDLDKLNAYNFKSEATKKSYLSQFKKLRKLTDTEISDTSQKKLIDIILDNFDNINSQQALINIAILVRRFYDYKTDKLEGLREMNKEKLNNHRKQQNTKIQDKLPTFDDIKGHTDDLFKDKKWTEYIINYLLINYYVRNKDLLFDIVKRKKHMTDKDKNYMWVNDLKKKVIYRRNDYKTSGTYGKKEHIITDPDFYYAMKKVFLCQKYDASCGVFIPNESQLGYYIKKATYDNLGETAYMKVMVKHYKNNLQKLKELSESRGTDINTIINHYDIDNK